MNEKMASLPRPLPWFKQFLILLTIVVPVIGTILAFYLAAQGIWSWKDLLILVITYTVGGLSITIGYHRLLSHYSFKTAPTVKFILLVLGASASMGDPLGFFQNHRHHHHHTDKKEDFHSPNSCPYNNKVMQFLYAHQLWRMYDARAEYRKYMQKTFDDPIVKLVSKTWYYWFFLELFLIYLFAGWTGVLWGGMVRIFLIHQVTFSINSICHMYGTREFDVEDNSGNVRGILMYLSFGDSIHQVHHAFDYTYDNALLPGMIDLSAIVIRLLHRMGLAWDLLRPTEERIRQKLKPEYAYLIP